MKRLIIAAVFTIAAVTQLYAQQGLKGIVRDDKGIALSFISILLKGTNVGTSTNSNGEYQFLYQMETKEL